MLIKELIEELKKADQEKEVLVEYENRKEEIRIFDLDMIININGNLLFHIVE